MQVVDSGSGQRWTWSPQCDHNWGRRQLEAPLAWDCLMSDSHKTTSAQPPDIDLRDRFAGSLLGLAVGDVLGAPLEGLHPAEIQRQHGRVTGLVVPPVTAGTNWYYWRLPGVHTDDTQQAITLADILADLGRLDSREVMWRWREMLEAPVDYVCPRTGVSKRAPNPPGCHRGTSGSFRKRVKDPDLPVMPNYGDGAAMRVAPVGLFYHKSRDQRIDAALRSAFLTHGHPHAAASAVAVAACIASACRTRSPDPQDLLATAVSEVNEADDLLRTTHSANLHPDTLPAIGEFSTTLHKLHSWLALPLQEALEAIAENGRQVLNSPLFATHSASLLAVTTALLVALRHLTSPKAAIIEAINLGGDTDTIGAIVGAITGAANTEAALPPSWHDALLSCPHIRMRAYRLFSPTIPPGFIPQLELETDLTRLELEEMHRLKMQS